MKEETGSETVFLCLERVEVTGKGFGGVLCSSILFVPVTKSLVGPELSNY